jgi:hypothetical protein
MKTVKDVASAFAQGKPARCGNAYTDGGSYWLHGNRIARKYNGFNLESQPRVEFNWCGWYTPTTANHMDECLNALGVLFTEHGNVGRPSHSRARDNNATVFVVDVKRATLVDVIQEVLVPSATVMDQFVACKE